MTVQKKKQTKTKQTKTKQTKTKQRKSQSQKAKKEHKKDKVPLKKRGRPKKIKQELAEDDYGAVARALLAAAPSLTETHEEVFARIKPLLMPNYHWFTVAVAQGKLIAIHHFEDVAERTATEICEALGYGDFRIFVVADDPAPRRVVRSHHGQPVLGMCRAWLPTPPLQEDVRRFKRNFPKGKFHALNVGEDLSHGR